MVDLSLLYNIIFKGEKLDPQKNKNKINDLMKMFEYAVEDNKCRRKIVFDFFENNEKTSCNKMCDNCCKNKSKDLQFLECNFYVTSIMNSFFKYRTKKKHIQIGLNAFFEILIQNHGIIKNTKTNLQKHKNFTIDFSLLQLSATQILKLIIQMILSDLITQKVFISDNLHMTIVNNFPNKQLYEFYKSNLEITEINITFDQKEKNKPFSNGKINQLGFYFLLHSKLTLKDLYKLRSIIKKKNCWKCENAQSIVKNEILPIFLTEEDFDLIVKIFREKQGEFSELQYDFLLNFIRIKGNIKENLIKLRRYRADIKIKEKINTTNSKKKNSEIIQAINSLEMKKETNYFNLQKLIKKVNN